MRRLTLLMALGPSLVRARCMGAVAREGAFGGFVVGGHVDLGLDGCGGSPCREDHFWIAVAPCQYELDYVELEVYRIRMSAPRIPGYDPPSQTHGVTEG